MDEDKTTIEGTEYVNKKPIVGAPSSYGTGSVIRELDDEGRLKRVTTSGAPLDTRNVKTPQEAATPNRIGDYYFDKTGAAQVWQNSPTDLLQKYQVAVGGTEKPAELLKPGAEALSILGGAAAGASALAIGGPAGMAVGGLIGGLAGGLSNLNASREEALKQWREQDVKYDSAVSFYKDEDGSVKYKVDYQKMGTGGERSGEAVKEAQNRETQVWLGDDGRLKVKVSPIFASTARYREMLDFISQNYVGLTKNTDNLEETLTEIRNAIDSEARDYVTNMKLYADFSHKFPNASPETIVASYATETAGYIDPTKMGDYQVTTLGDDDKVTTQSAEQFFNSVLDMDKTKRNELATKLNDIVYGDSGGYTDEQRAVAYGELQAIYAASANPEKYDDNKYQGMMDADPFVSFMNSFSPLGLNVGDVIKFVSGGAYSKQEMLNQDEWAQFFGGAAGIGAGLGLWRGASSLIERGLKLLPGTAQLYAASAAGKGYDNVMALFAEGKTAAGVGAWAAEAAFKTLKVGTLDAVLAGAQTAVSGENFWANFGQDFARDAALEMIFSYYDMAQMQKAVSDNTVYVYVDPKTGNLRKLNTYAGEKFSTYEMSDDGLITEAEYREGLDVTQWQTRQGNTGTVLKTPGGTTVTVVDGKVEYTPGGKIVDGEVVDITEDISEIPVMNSGIVNTSRGQTDIATLLERAGLPADTQVMEMPESAANSAIVAGKFAKLQGTKFGMEVYKQLFNSNAVLDVANNDALAKDGDLNAWRNAQELFVSVANNAQRNLQDIQNGVYLKDASTEWAKTIDIMGQFNYQYKYKPKTDGAYINAVLNIERAQLLNDSRVEGDTTDYVTKAVETYKDVLAAMPADRGAALQEWVAQGKKWLKAFNDSVRKSGKVDVEKLDNITETDISESIGWFPVWAKRQKYTGLLDTFRGINKERNPYRSWLRDGEWVPADKLGDPWQNMNRYMAFMTNNMGLNDMNEAAMDVYDRAGLLVDNTPTEATIRKRKLDSVKNKDELNKKLDDMVAEVKKEVEEQALTPAQYSEMMAQIYEESAISETAEALSKDVFFGSTQYVFADEIAEIEKDVENYVNTFKLTPPITNVGGKTEYNGTQKALLEKYNFNSSRLVTPGAFEDKLNRRIEKLKQAGRGQQGDSGELKVFDEIPSTLEQKDMLDTSPESAPSPRYANLKDYYAKEKGMEADFVYMTPDEYLEALLEKNGGISSYQTIDDIVKRTRKSTPYHNGWGDYAEDMRTGNFNPELSEGGKFPPPYLAYRANGVAQEGIHRALAARSLGITKMPVVVETPVKNKPAAAKKLLEGKARVKYPQSSAEQTTKETGTPQLISEQQWNEFWNNAPAQTRKDIRSELGLSSYQRVTYEKYQKGLQADPEMAGRIRDSYRGAMADKLIKEATRAIALAENYLGPYGYGADWQSYLNTSLIPDLQAAINQNMLPEEFQSFVQARIAQAMQDMAPYQSPEILLKSRLERVAEEWREWALKHIKAGRATQGELKEFANTHELNLPNDKRPLPNKIKHALWQIVQDGKRLPEINGLNPAAISKEMDQDLFYRMLDDTPLFQSAVKDKNELLDLISLEKNKETTDGFTMGAASTAAGLGGRYPITKFKNGKPYTRFIKYDTPEHLLIAEQTTKALNDKELLKEDGLISRTAAMFANDFRLLVTGWDPSRAIPNLFRDTTSSFMKTRFISPRKQLQAALDLGNYTPKQRANLEKAIENAANAAAGSSYNSAYRSTRSGMTEITKQYLSQNGASPMKRFFFNLRKDKRSIAEWPMEFFEGYSRRANARSLAAVQLRRDQKAGKSYKEQMKNATTAADWAGREYTANFQRKGELIGRVSKYVAYQSSAYAGFDSWVRAFINDPTTVSRNFAAFVLAYLVLLADTLSREDTRKQYYRLSEYDRENQIVIGMGDSILTIPMDQTLAGMIFPYRRIMETLNGTDPVSFFEFVWGTLTAALPPDLSGFSEGDGFNLSRGLQKLAAQNMPNIASGIVEASTGLDLYYGSQTSVSDETLRNYGIYNPTPGDYTTTGNDSEILRNVANTTGIPQWQLQVMLENYGGNIGKYVLNILDKMAGAPEQRQGGKDFADTVFNSFTGLDQDAASSAFYEGIQQLGQEKNALLQKISDYNESLKTASGDAKIELQNKIQQAKRDYGTKVGDFVDKYISAYEITGGLSKKQAQQVYYLFRLDDDDTIYQSGSVEEYYNNQALQQFKNQATALSAPVLDKYYNNRRGNVYQDSEGVWRRYLPSASQAMRNSIYGAGEQQMVDLLNILEGKTSNLTSYRSQIKNLRNQAYEAGDWDARDALAYELDKKVIEAISPYIERYGAEYVLGNSNVLSYLSEWFIVPDDFIRTKKGKYVSLGNNASTQKAFVQPFIKYIFGLPTNFSSYNDTKIAPKAIGEM